MYKKVIALTLAVALATGCADNRKLPQIDKHEELPTYGLFDKADEKRECVNYELQWGNIVWSAIFMPSVIIPLYFIGFSIYEPVSVNQECLDNLKEAK